MPGEGRLREVVEETAELHGLDLVELQSIAHRGRRRLRVFVDRTGGVTINECARLSRALSRALDDEEVIAVPYVLEVSSPGVHRPLRSERDFARVEGRKVRIRTDEGQVMVGLAGSVSEGALSLLLPDGAVRTVDLAHIEHAALELSLAKD
jgi:ribosome maturation factor RimP